MYQHDLSMTMQTEQNTNKNTRPLLDAFTFTPLQCNASTAIQIHAHVQNDWFIRAQVCDAFRIIK